jgi:hypothetical protein
MSYTNELWQRFIENESISTFLSVTFNLSVKNDMQKTYCFTYIKTHGTPNDRPTALFSKPAENRNDYAKKGGERK